MMKATDLSSSIAKNVAFYGVCTALTVALSYLDSLLSLAIPLVGFRLGLANLVIIFILATKGIKSGFVMSILRSFFVGLTRGFTAGIISISGGIFSFIIVAILLKILKVKIKFTSIWGAIAHTSGQLLGTVILLKSSRVLYYGMFLIPISIVTGLLIGIILDRLLIFGRKVNE